MKALVIAIAMMSFAATAQADGFRCQSEGGEMNVKIYNHTAPEAGTRNGAVMVLSNPEISRGSKTIASFSSAKGTLEQKGARYVGSVDLRVSESSRAGEFIGRTRLGMLKEVVVALDHNILEPIAHGEEVTGRITLKRRDGNKESYRLECTRYLKGA